MNTNMASSCLKGDLWESSIPIRMNSMFSDWAMQICQSNLIEDVNQSVPSVKHKLKMNQIKNGCKFLDTVGHPATLLSRWFLSLEHFGRYFDQDFISEPASYIHELGSFSTKETRFRKQMERLRCDFRKDLTLEVSFMNFFLKSRAY